NTQAPLILPGMLSTAGHWDQSSAAMNLPPRSRLRQIAAPVTSSSRGLKRLHLPQPPVELVPTGENAAPHLSLMNVLEAAVHSE
ncbi:MAG TPA: hypothetical protein VFT47_04100, partial [Vicinamibacterales bacterium]|nr:hypothetical protein [Vicinamibacterales bacterium]